MSLNIYGNFNPTITVVNSNTVVKDVSVNIPSYLNRKTTATALRAYLKARGNKFDRGLWQPPLVAELPNGDQQLFDGDHRRALWRHAYPNQPLMPAQIIKVKNKKEISELFVVINKTGRRSLKPNEVFVHEVLSGVQHAINTEAHLQKCGLSVSLGTGLPNSVVGAPNSPEVQIKGFRDSVKDNSLAATSSSAHTITNTWKGCTSVAPELLRGLARIYDNTNVGTKHPQEFRDFIKQTALIYPKQKDMSSMFKNQGGRIGNHDDECIAKGALELFKKFVTNKSYANSFTSRTFNRYYKDYMDELEQKLK